MPLRFCVEDRLALMRALRLSVRLPSPTNWMYVLL